MFTLRHHSTSRLLRTSVLLALLCVFGLQFHEAGHHHGMDEQAIECLLCKGSTDIAPLASTASSGYQFTAPLRAPRAISLPAVHPVPAYHPRGPPGYS